MPLNKLFIIIGVIALLGLQIGCDANSRYKALSTVFDGVPALPPPEKACADYAEERLEALRQELAGIDEANANSGESAQNSRHQPYAEKNCASCHAKNKQSGFVRPLDELCLSCHTDFVQGSFVHGPVAVRDCLACHLPHTSANPYLLKASTKEICSYCHKEDRLAADMHDRVAEHNMSCLDCHDPHFSDTALLLK